MLYYIFIAYVISAINVLQKCTLVSEANVPQQLLQTIDDIFI